MARGCPPGATARGGKGGPSPSSVMAGILGRRFAKITLHSGDSPRERTSWRIQELSRRSGLWTPSGMGPSLLHAASYTELHSGHSTMLHECLLHSGCPPAAALGALRALLHGPGPWALGVSQGTRRCQPRVLHPCPCTSTGIHAAHQLFIQQAAGRRRSSALPAVRPPSWSTGVPECRPVMEYRPSYSPGGISTGPSPGPALPPVRFSPPCHLHSPGHSPQGSIAAGVSRVSRQGPTVARRHSSPAESIP